MAIKTRLILAMAALLCAATFVIGSVAIGAVTRVMTSRIDAQLSEFMHQASDIISTDDITTASDTEPAAYQPIAVMFFGPDGKLLHAVPAGYPDQPLALPALQEDPGTVLDPVRVGSFDHGVDYRMRSQPISPLFAPRLRAIPVTMVAAMPMVEVDAVQQDLMFVMIVTVTSVLVVGIGAAWWITRRGLRPVTDMIDAAVGVADGDLTRRLPSHSERTEIGKLATALNIMVSKLVDAITQRDTQQARLRRFVADASHELRTPLAAISGYAELYESGGAPPGPTLDRAMGRIRGESHRMAALVDDLLLLARLDQETSPTLRRLDLRQLAYDAVDDARATDDGHDIAVRAPAPLIVMGHDARLRQVVGNLLTNARTHTPPGTSVWVVAEQHGPVAVVSVADNGPGIAPEHRPRVFDRFYRADDSRSRDTGGTGLGLSIVKSIVESHGGRVELDSEPGAGTVFRFVLPLAPPGEPPTG
ncbi:two-component system OmpR family sensor kinase [Stackebrandtia albiflava]|uniref:histidine kinase n=1 Tax=Stackebrandtia albiflava TaxID=406432 RepID=A0A562VE99_9ACTN|nr:HAMP domain-containing sensor histidine kinase [Stackebrandtia albiflava]TWJ16216.1 two-component system OmpR family sensor kinase [Stackebrandtia albiflava]